MAQRNYGRDIIVMSNRQPARVNCWLQFHRYKNSEEKKKWLINTLCGKIKRRWELDKVKWILKFLDLCLLQSCVVSYWGEAWPNPCHSARWARGDWRLVDAFDEEYCGVWFSFHWAPGMEQLQHSLGCIYCWSVSFLWWAWCRGIWQGPRAMVPQWGSLQREHLHPNWKELFCLQISIIISIPFLVFLPPTFTHSHAAPGERVIAKAQELIGYLKTGG